MARNRTEEKIEGSDVGSAEEVLGTEDAAKEALKIEKKEARTEAQTLVRAFIKTLDSVGDEGLKTAMTLLIGSGTRARRGSVSSINTVLRDLIVAAGDEGVSEMDIFKQFKIGQPEMTTKVRIFLKTPNPEDRIWVKFFEEDEMYRMVGKGSKAPDGWDGFTPADENLL